MTTEQIQKRHRPPEFRKINKSHLEKLARAGWTDEQMADFFGTDRNTLNRWKARYPDFAQKLKDWKEDFDHQIERSLAKRAEGFYATETKVFCHEGKIITHDIPHYFPPDPVSMIFWLTNRLHGDWKRTREAEGADPLSVKVFNIMREYGNGKKNGKPKLDNKIPFDTTVHIERGGMQVVE